MVHVRHMWSSHHLEDRMSPNSYRYTYRPMTYLWLHWMNAWVALGPILLHCRHRKCFYVLGTVVSREYARPPLCFLFINYCSNDPPEGWENHLRALPLLPNHA